MNDELKSLLSECHISKEFCDDSYMRSISLDRVRMNSNEFVEIHGVLNRLNNFISLEIRNNDIAETTFEFAEVDQTRIKKLLVDTAHFVELRNSLVKWKEGDSNQRKAFIFILSQKIKHIQEDIESNRVTGNITANMRKKLINGLLVHFDFEPMGTSPSKEIDAISSSIKKYPSLIKYLTTEYFNEVQVELGE